MVQIEADTARDHRRFAARCAIVTLPLGVLQAGLEAVGFEPCLPAAKQAALDKLVMGKVVRVTLCFRKRFWENLIPPGATRSLAGLSFLFSRDPFFPTWWSTMPEPLPILTGWGAAHCAERLERLNGEPEVIEQCAKSLARLLGLPPGNVREQLRKAYFHDWTHDRFSLGAYSYVKAGGEGSQQVLAAPVEQTLFFAGEASDTTGHNGTVHGAIATGKRAANEVLLSLRP
jgi:monoamine oxidase